MSDAIEFNAIIYKVQTLVDGGIRLTLDLPEDIQAATKLLQAKQQNAYLAIAAVALDLQTETYGKSKLDKGNKRKSEWQTGQEPGADGNP